MYYVSIHSDVNAAPITTRRYFLRFRAIAACERQTLDLASFTPSLVYGCVYRHTAIDGSSLEHQSWAFDGQPYDGDADPYRWTY